MLDDGWFQGRRDDTTSLGDWVVDSEVWPDGLVPLAARVHDLGMQFGLWFEPEMVSLDSDVARAHPEWLLHDPGHLDHDAELSWRTQYVLDLANPDAYAHVLGQLDAVVREVGVDFIKWDHNRDLVESTHDGRPGGHLQMLAVYRLIAELKHRHPALEIESCSSGGARTDLGILEVCDRVWASDSNDPVERQDIQRWTGLLLPPELVGAHVGPHHLAQLGTHHRALVPDGDEPDGLGGLRVGHPVVRRGRDRHDPAVRRALPRAAARRPHRRRRPPRPPGSRVAGDRVRRRRRLGGSWSPRWRASRTPARSGSGCRGSIPTRRYRVRVRREIGDAEYGWIAPEWYTDGAIELPGRMLGEVGLQLPTLWPVQAFVLHVTAID